jgi:TolB-like protein/Flp pilus assembly protein TadD
MLESSYRQETRKLSFINELKRRKVLRVSIAYVIGAWLLLQLTEVLSELLNLPDTIGPIVVGLVAIGLPIVVVLTWMFELTSDGLKRDHDVADAERSSGRVINVLVIGLLFVALGYFVWESRFKSETSLPGNAERTAVSAESGDTSSQSHAIGRSIAVLPFENFSGDKENEYFADGLADTLLHKLAQISDLKVIARNSSFQFKGSNKDVREIGEILGVATILEGSVQRSGEQIRIIAQLVRTDDGAHIWSQSFDGSTGDIFDLQDQVTSNIVDQFQLSLTAAEQSRLLRDSTSNPEAYDLVIRALNQYRSLDETVDVRAEDDEKIRLLQSAVELDPNYALAWAYLSDAWNALAFVTDSSQDHDRYVAEAQKAAEEALRLDPALPDAHSALGWVAHRKDEKLEAARHFRKALELNPNSLTALSGLALQTSDPEEMLKILNRSHELDPTSAIVYRQKHFALIGLGRPQEAIEQLKLAIELAPKEGMFYNDLADLLEREGRPDEGARYASRLLEFHPDSFSGQMALAESWLAATDYERATQWVELLLRNRDGSDEGKQLKVEILVAAQEYEEALDLLDTMGKPGGFDVGLTFRRLPACLADRRAECALQQTQKLQAALEQFKTRGPAPGEFEFYIGLAHILVSEISEPGLDISEFAAELLEHPAATNAGLFGDLHFSRAGLAARKGDTALAIRYLENSFLGMEGSILNRDVFGLAAEQSLLLDPLRDVPEFSDWLMRYQERSDAMRQRMQAMESRGEIISIATAERMVTP